MHGYKWITFGVDPILDGHHRKPPVRNTNMALNQTVLQIMG